MKAARIFGYNQPLRVVETPEPVLSGPYDVILRVAGAGVCRTDLHILEGMMQEALGHPRLPYTIGHENAGWIEAVGSAVEHLAKGDPVVVHPVITCGFCRACRAGNDMHCSSRSFPGLDGSDGGYAELLQTSARSVVKLAPGIDPATVAPYSDAGLTAYHAVKKIAPLTYPGSTVVMIGVGGLGHFAVQLLPLLTTARVIALDTRPERLELARSLGAQETVAAGTDGGVETVLEHTDGIGADVVIDFVGEHGTPAAALKMLRKGGTYSVVGYGGPLEHTTLDIINRELNILGNVVGTYNDLVELMELDRQGKIRSETRTFPLDDVVEVLDKVEHGRIPGRAVLIPG